MSSDDYFAIGANYCTKEDLGELVGLEIHKN